MKKHLAEFIGTFTLVLVGCGAAVLAGGDIGLAGISFAFGFALIGMAYGIGPVSGCHINPAVSLGAVSPQAACPCPRRQATSWRRFWWPWRAHWF